MVTNMLVTAFYFHFREFSRIFEFLINSHERWKIRERVLWKPWATEVADETSRNNRIHLFFLPPFPIVPSPIIMPIPKIMQNEKIHLEYFNSENLRLIDGKHNSLQYNSLCSTFLGSLSVLSSCMTGCELRVAGGWMCMGWVVVRWWGRWFGYGVRGGGACKWVLVWVCVNDCVFGDWPPR